MGGGSFRFSRESVRGGESSNDLAGRLGALDLRRKQDRLCQRPALGQNAQHVLKCRRALAGYDSQPAGGIRERTLARLVEQPFAGEPFLERLELGVELAPSRRTDFVCIELVLAAFGIDCHVPARQYLVALPGEPGVTVRVSAPHHRIYDRAAVLHAEVDVAAGRSRPAADFGQDPDVPEQLVLLEQGSQVRGQLRYRQWIHGSGILPRLLSVLTGKGEETEEN